MRLSHRRPNFFIWKLDFALHLIMGWLKPKLRNSIYGLLGGGSEPSDSVLENGTEDVREAMLSCLGPEAPRRFPHLTRRIRYAADVHALWYLRGDLMAALASLQGETAARETLAPITARFRGLLPGAMTSRPSPLES
ncbi:MULTISPECIES: hypothetical protein [Ramlibacter]|nr:MULTISPECIES: hypothetical protein [Ramlibacter]